jgi:hypothetical protein
MIVSIKADCTWQWWEKRVCNSSPIAFEWVRYWAGLALRSPFRHREGGLFDRCLRTNGYGQQHECSGRATARSKVRSGELLSSLPSLVCSLIASPPPLLHYRPPTPFFHDSLQPFFPFSSVWSGGRWPLRAGTAILGHWYSREWLAPNDAPHRNQVSATYTKPINKANQQ